jgi:hypothetical protein
MPSRSKLSRLNECQQRVALQAMPVERAPPRRRLLVQHMHTPAKLQAVDTSPRASRHLREEVDREGLRDARTESGTAQVQRGFPWPNRRGVARRRCAMVHLPFPGGRTKTLKAHNPARGAIPAKRTRPSRRSGLLVSNMLPPKGPVECVVDWLPHGRMPPCLIVSTLIPQRIAPTPKRRPAVTWARTMWTICSFANHSLSWKVLILTKMSGVDISRA